MARSRFRMPLHRKTHRITYMLVYAIFEWILIAFLLLNSLFVYVIGKFTMFFGLQPSCLLCSRIDHLFKPDDARVCSLGSLLCSAYSAEVFGLGYCFHHRRLVKARAVCEGCLSSWKKMEEAGEKDLAFSCCTAVMKPSLHKLENSLENDLPSEIAGDREEEGQGYILLAQ